MRHWPFRLKITDEAGEEQFFYTSTEPKALEIFDRICLLPWIKVIHLEESQHENEIWKVKWHT